MTTRFDRIIGEEPKPALVRKAKKAKPEPPPPPDTRSVREKIEAEVYKTKLPWPDHKDPSYKAKRDAYHQDQSRLEAKLRADLFEECGVTNNPKADLCWSKAWDHGHSSGYYEVVTWFEDLVELIE